MILSFSAVEALFALRHDIAEVSTMAFRGRLQHFQRLKFPEGVNTGKGRRAQYGWAQLFQLAYALDLVELGQPPEIAARIIAQHFPNFMLASATQVPTLIVLEISGLSGLKADGNEEIAQVWPMTKSNALKEIENLGRAYSKPLTIIDPLSISSFFLDTIPSVSDLSKESVQASFNEWSERACDLLSGEAHLSGKLT